MKSPYRIERSPVHCYMTECYGKAGEGGVGCACSRRSPSYASLAVKEYEDAALCDVVRRAEQGVVDADLGGGVIKQRIARPGQGRARGLRSIVLFRRDERAFFVHGFAKSRQATLRPDELTAFQTPRRHAVGPGRCRAGSRNGQRNDQGGGLRWQANTRVRRWPPCMKPHSV